MKKESFFRNWFKFFSWTIIVLAVLAFIIYLDITITGKQLPNDKLKNLAIFVLLVPLFAYPWVVFCLKILDLFFSKVGTRYELTEKVEKRIQKKTLTTIRLVLAGILILVVLLIILNG